MGYKVIRFVEVIVSLDLFNLEVEVVFFSFYFKESCCLIVSQYIGLFIEKIDCDVEERFRENEVEIKDGKGIL